MNRWLPLLLLVAGCEGLFPEEPEKNCDPRIPYWPDADGDGVGDAGTSVYLGCAAPDGYVDVPPSTGGDQVGDTDLDSDPDSDLDSDLDSDVDTDADSDTDPSPVGA